MLVGPDGMDTGPGRSGLFLRTAPGLTLAPFPFPRPEWQPYLTSAPHLDWKLRR